LQIKSNGSEKTYFCRNKYFQKQLFLLFMLSRRHLRIKALQALYGHFIKADNDLALAEKNLLKSTERLYELAVYQLSFLVEIVKFADKRIEENKKKFYPTQEDLNPNTKFVENAFIQKLSQNKDFLRRKNAYRINWAEQDEMIRKAYNEIRQLTVYQQYMAEPARSFEADRVLIAELFVSYMAENQSLEYFYEEISVYWANDIDIANYCVLKIINSINKNHDEFHPLPSLYNQDGKLDADEDKKFLIRLFHKTILKSRDFEQLIEEKASNWELNRIALMDIILLKLALAELIEFPSIPVKVTINECIELAKSYSTPKSRVFINGILDKMINEMKAEGKIVKTGRGLIE
jgi:transcription antitermination protein NusB